MPTIVLDKATLDSWGRQRVAIATVQGDAAGYLTADGGIALEAAIFGLKTIRGMQVIGSNPVAGRLYACWDPAAGGLRVFYPTGGATASPSALADPVPSTPVLAHATDSTPVLSTAAAMPDHAATAGTQLPGRGKEVLDATDLSTATWTVLVIGE